ncbi:MAG TPA: FAD-binding oxidoreductase [Chitinophagales bacterium]|nr:FAD-binding oxidoreductase [Chitinophagales bacterium]
MNRKLNRKDFIKLTALGVTGLYISSCKLSENKNENTSEKPIIDEKGNISFNISEDDVIFYKKNDASYEKLRQGFNKRIQKFPLVIAACKTTNGIIAAIQYAKENKLPVSIKSGGHCFEGFSSNNDGLVINLSLMNKISWIDENAISVQPGCTLAQLYDEILPKQKIIPAGSCGGVGVAGLALGGGYGFFSRKYGLTCDSLADFSMIDSDGKVQTAKDNPDLLWACKGGGNGNFGVISELTFKLQETPNHFTSHRFRLKNATAEKAELVLQKWFELTKNLPLSCFSAFVLNQKTILILLTDYENNTDTVQQFQKELTSITDTQSIGKPKALAESLKVFRGQSAPTFFKNSSAGLYNGFDDIKPFISQVLGKVTTTPRMIYQINTLGGNINNAAFENASAYPHRKYNYLSELQTYWENSTETPKFETAFEEVQRIFKKNNINTQYRNYPDINFEDAQRLYFADNYERLQAIKQKYDAENLFRYEQSIVGRQKIG